MRNTGFKTPARIRDYPNVVNVKTMFGAAGDDDGTGNGTDDAAAIQAAVTSAQARNDLVYIPPGYFRIGSQISNPNVVPIVMDGVFIFTGSGESALIMGADDGSFHRPINTTPSVIRVQRASIDWTDVQTGVEIVNVEELVATVWVQNFHTGLRLRGNDVGVVNNEITLRRMRDNRFGVELFADGTTGWANQNTFYGGFFSTHSTNTNDPGNVHGVVFTVNSSSTINGNQFHNPSFELYNVGAGFTSCFHGRSLTGKTQIASFNNVIGYRQEATDFLLSGLGLFENIFMPSRGNVTINLGGTLISGDSTADSTAMIQNKWLATSRGQESKDELQIVGSLDRANMVVATVGGTPRAYAPGNAAIWWGTTADRFQKRLDLIALTTETIQNNKDSAIIGLLFDLRNVPFDIYRYLSLSVDAAATGGRMAVSVWDSAYNRLTAQENVFGLTYSAGSDFFQDGSEMSALLSQVGVSFSPSVAYVFIGVTKGTAQAEFRSIKVKAYNDSHIRLIFSQALMSSLSSLAVTVPTFEPAGPVCEAIPDAPGAGNSYPDGLFVKNYAPSELGAGGSKYVVLGWIYNGTLWLESRALTGN